MANGPNPLTAPLLQVQDLIAADTPETLEAAENLIRSFADRLPLDRALGLQKQLAAKREQNRQFQRVREISAGPQALTPPTDVVDLERTGPTVISTNFDEQQQIGLSGVPAQLEDFALPEGALPPGGREVGRLISSSGDFARAVVEGPQAAPQDPPPFSTEQIAELGLLLQGVKGGSNILNKLILSRGTSSGGAKLTALQSEGLVKAGVKLGNRAFVSQITADEFKRADALDAKEKATLEKQINAATENEKLDEFLSINDMLKVVNPQTLQGPQSNLTRRQLGQGLKDDTLIISSPKNIASARELQGSIAPMLRLFDLTKKLIVAQPGENFFQQLDFFSQNQIASSADIAIFTTSKAALALQLAAIINQGRPSEKDAERIEQLFPTSKDSIKTAIPKMINVMRFVTDQAKAKLGVAVIDPRFFKILREGAAPSSTFKNAPSGAAPQFRVGPDGQLRRVNP